ncbi:sialidase family protein [Lysinibacillus capsici]|uniref:sialidase family protein n=1 Tax=Lysinibacillus capsici TaxID=2115968 RepID=UPI002E2283A4|nr:sialidase family protein [Lysinibacillus capsici]
MAQHYYDKFTAIENKQYNDDAPWINSSASIGPFSSYAKSYSFDRVNNKYTLGPAWGYDGGPVNIGSIVYSLSGNFLYRHSAKEYTYDPTVTVPVNSVYKDASSNTSSIIDYSKGSPVESNIVAEDGTYPVNGRHTDGFWYVRGAAVGPSPLKRVTIGSSIQGNGGRKQVRLNNGSLFAVSFMNQGLYLHRSLDKGLNWETTDTLSVASPYIFVDAALTTDGNKIYALFTYRASANICWVYLNIYDNTGKRTNTQILVDGNSSGYLGAVYQCSITIDPTNGYLYAAWECITTARPASKNIRMSISTDGGLSWATPMDVTTFNAQYWNSSQPSIAVNNGTAYISFISQTGQNGFNLNLTKRTTTNQWTNVVLKSQSTQLVNTSMVVDKDGAIHLIGNGTSASGEVYYFKSTNNGTSWSTVKELVEGTAVNTAYEPSISVDRNNVVFVTWYQVRPSSTLLRLCTRKLTNNVWSAITVLTDTAQHLQHPSLLFDPYFKLSFNDTPPMLYGMGGSPRSVWYEGGFSTNQNPTITLISPSNSQTLYENDVINISGDAYDADKDQSVTVFYQINSEQRKVLATNVSQTQITLSKQITFKGGKLYDGEMVLTGVLAEGVAHTLKVWAVDSENGQSATIERTFYVVPNRAPLLAIDAVVPSGIINTDKFKISGTASDQDANSNIKVNYRINGANPVEVYNGAGGAWEFEVSLAQLVVNENTIIIEVIDNYDAKTSKTIKLNKNEVKTPILQSVARYKISPPKGSARGVLIWVQRDEELDLRVELSMTLVGEQEQYILLEADPDKIVPVTDGIVEDEYYHETVEPKDNIILKLTTTRPNISIDNKVYLIMGVVE